MSASKRKGTAWETAIVEYLADVGLDARRVALAGAWDRGDVEIRLGPDVVTIEAKNARAVELAAWLDEADREAGRAGSLLGVVWHHRRGRASPGGGFVTMSGEDFARLLLAAVDGDLLGDRIDLFAEPDPWS